MRLADQAPAFQWILANSNCWVIQLNDTQCLNQQKTTSPVYANFSHFSLSACELWPQQLWILSTPISVIFMHFFAFISQIGQQISVHLAYVGQQRCTFILSLQPESWRLVELGKKNLALSAWLLTNVCTSLFIDITVPLCRQHCSLGNCNFDFFSSFLSSCTQLSIINYAIMLLTNRKEIKLTCFQRKMLNNCEICSTSRNITADCL